jgi:peptide subunit release factor 1 (eRF1)
MLDDLLGRTELKTRIAALEDERDDLQAQLADAEERRTEAVRARQDAQERVNRLEDRIADLEGKVDAERTATEDLSVRHRETVRGNRLEALLSRLESVEAEPETVLTAVVAGDIPVAVSDHLGDRAALVDRASPCVVCVDDAGLVAAALRPPIVTEPFIEWSDSPSLDRSWFQPTGRYALALVRSDVFAVGVYETGDRLDYEGFTSDVKGDHSKGGFSQARFERLRDEQIADHVGRCRDVLAGVDADRLYVTGDRRLVGEFEASADETAAVDATGDPEPALADAHEAFWSVRLYGL